VEEAKRSAIVAAFQQHVADTINEVTANHMRGRAKQRMGEPTALRGIVTRTSHKVLDLKSTLSRSLHLAP